MMSFLGLNTCVVILFPSATMKCCLPTPMNLASGGSPIFPLVVNQPALRPSGQQCTHSGWVRPQIQGWQCGVYVGAVEEMMCVVCVSITEGE